MVDKNQDFLIFLLLGVIAVKSIIFNAYLSYYSFNGFLVKSFVFLAINFLITFTVLLNLINVLRNKIFLLVLYFSTVTGQSSPFFPQHQ